MTDQNLIQGYVERFRDKHTITVATGITCAYLGDERNLREHLIADEVVKALRAEGHIVHFLCFNDDLDPLSYRQLRVAVEKRADDVAQFEPYCGRPISDIRSPYDLNISWSKHFQRKFAERLGKLDSHPHILSVANLYDRGLYAPFVRMVLLNQDRIRDFLAKNFPTYHPEKLFWPVCPVCGYIEGTSIGPVSDQLVEVNCQRCLTKSSVPIAEIRGKMNWKLDCAARWSIFKVDAEPFSKEYLEPNTGSFMVAQALSKEFFGGSDVVPIHYGSVSLPKHLGGAIIECLPTEIVRGLFVKNGRADLELTEERILTEANKFEVLPDLTFADLVKQLLPAWSLDTNSLSPEQRELLAKGTAYAKRFENRQIKPFLPNREHLEGVPTDILRQIQGILQQVVLMREAFGIDYESFVGPAKSMIERLGSDRKSVTRHFRRMIGQEQGVPNSRFLYYLPTSYLKNLESLIDLYLGSTAKEQQSYAVVPSTQNIRGSRERLAFEH